MNFVVKHDNVDISDHVIEYGRHQFICTGVATLDVTLEYKELSRNILPWDKIELWESGSKVGKFIVSTREYSADGGALILQCQDYSKKLVDHFVFETNIVPYTTTTKYWIEKFLQEADVDYDFTVPDDGEIVAPNMSYGMASAYELIVSLMQQCGWYLYFDANGTAKVGTLERSGAGYDEVLDDFDILNLERNRNDTRLRNRALVWGATDPYTGAFISADVSVQTPWNYDSHDERTVVLSSSYIYSTQIARLLARRLLNEFSNIGNEIVIEIANHYDIKLGNMVYVNSRHFGGRMRVTTIESSGSADGLKVKLTLNQKCPRLFSYYAELPGESIPVYIGTWGAGVWKRYTDSLTWLDASLGLENLYIKDLFIKMGNMACVANDGYLYYSNIATNIWTKFEHGEFIDLYANLYLEDETKAVACSIDDMGNIMAGYNYDDGTTKRSWLVTVTPTGEKLRVEQIFIDNIITNGVITTNEEVQLIDLEAGGVPEDGDALSVTSDMEINWNTIGYRTYSPPYSIDPNCYSIGPAYSYAYQQSSQSMPVTHLGTVLVEYDDRGWYLDNITTIKQVDLKSLEVLNTYTFTGVDTGTNINYDEYYGMAKVGNTFHIFKFRHPTIEEYDDGNGIIGCIFFHYSWYLGNPSVTLESQITLDPLFGTTPGSPGFMRIMETCVIFDNYEGNIGMINSYKFLTETISTRIIDIGTLEEEGYGFGFMGRYVGYTSQGVNIIYAWLKHKEEGLFGNRIPNVVLGAEFVYADAFGSLSPGSAEGALFETENSDPYLILRGGFGSYNLIWSGICNSSGLSYLLFEFILDDRDWGGGGDTVSIRQISVVARFSFPNGLYFDDRIVYGPNNGTSLYYTDTLFLHSVDNAWKDDPYNDTILYNTSRIDGRVYSPAIMRIGMSYNSSYFLSCLSADLEVSNIPTPNNAAPVNVIAVKSRDDYTGYVYVKAWDGLQYNLYGIDYDSGAIATTISDFEPVLANPFITKTYLITDERIISFTPPLMFPEKPYILKHLSNRFEDQTIIGAAIDAQESTYGTYEVVLEPDGVCRVENSKWSPIVVYTSPHISGGFGFPYLSASRILSAGEFYLPPENEYTFYDARVFDIPDPYTYTIESGSLPSTSILERYIGLATSGAISIIQYDFDGEFYPLVTMSGLMTMASGLLNPSGAITTFETSNFTISPYLFIGISGPPAMFFQRSPLGSYFYSYSSTLPSGADITIIRVDDDI